MNSQPWFSALVLLVSALSSFCFGGEERVESPTKPNIIFLMADDQATYSLGCYGTPGVSTPNIDQLAREGMVFDNHYDTTAICMGSRANVMTGLLEYRNGCNFEHGPLRELHWRESYPMLLRKAGYTTAFAGKFGFEVASEERRAKWLPSRDFDRWGGSPGQSSYVTSKNASMKEYAKEFPHSTRAYGAFGRDFVLQAAKQQKPFCLSISFKAPHRPVSPDPLYDDVYAGKTFTKPANYGREHGLHFSKQSRQGRQYPRFLEWKYATDYDSVMALYYQQIFAIDVAVGMIREAVAKAGVKNNTVFIYTSDNGFLCGSHGYGSKVLPYEEASRVPLIVFDPRGANSGKQLRCRALTGNIDIAPTILALAGVHSKTQMDGRSLLPLYADPLENIRETMPLINVWGPAAAHSLSIVTKDWKYIYWPYGAAGFTPTEELYHTQEDGLELKNLVKQGSASEQLERMRNHYDQAVAHWRETAVAYHHYQEFGSIFDRRLTWEEKVSRVAKSKRSRSKLKYKNQPQGPNR